MNQGRLRVFCLWLSDLVCIYGSWALFLWLYITFGHMHLRYGIEFYYRLWPIGIVFTAMNLLFKLYHGGAAYPAAPVSPVEEFRRLIGSSFVTHIGLLAFLGFAYGSTKDYSRFVIAASGITTAFIAQPFRDAVRAMLFRLGIGRIPVVIAGSGGVAKRLAEILFDSRYIGFNVLGYFDAVGCGDDFKCPYLGRLQDIVPISRKLKVKILLCCQDERLFKCQMREFTEWFSYIEYLPTADAFPVFGARAVIMDGLGGLEMVNQRRMMLLRIEKWLIDKILSLVSFLIASPLFIILPLLIKLTSAGPVYYRQERIGKNGRKIRVWKFRSMYADADERLERMLADNPELAAEWQKNFKLKRDPRVTPLGKILRATSLDELPQLFNVFVGQMALIGPRPIIEDEVALYGESYQVFASVKPGVTGLWQVSGRSDTDYARRVSLDTYYVLNWSPWMDLWIMFRTLYAVIFMRGAR